MRSTIYMRRWSSITVRGLRTLFLPSVLVPEPGLGVGSQGITFATSMGYEDGASRDSHGLRHSPAERIRTNRAAQNKVGSMQLLSIEGALAFF